MSGPASVVTVVRGERAHDTPVAWPQSGTSRYARRALHRRPHETIARRFGLHQRRSRAVSRWSPSRLSHVMYNHYGNLLTRCPCATAFSCRCSRCRCCVGIT